MKDNPNRENILNVSKNLFYYYGYNNTSIRKIAAELNMSNVNLFNYFKNKKEILSVIFDDFFKHMTLNLKKVKEYSDDNAIETIMIYILTFHYALSYDKHLSDLYYEAIDENIIVDIFMKNQKGYYQVIGDKLSKESYTEDDLSYLIYVLFEAMDRLFVRSKNNDLNLSISDLRDKHISLLLKLFCLNREDFLEEEKRATFISKKLDYKAISTFWTIK